MRQESVEASVSALGLTTERIYGKTRYGTAAAIAENLTEEPTEVFFVYSLKFADALSVSTAAAQKNAPLIYLDKDGELNADTAAYLEKIKGKVNKAYVIGGSGVISDEMADKAAKAVGLETAERISGANRYLTCLEINKKFADLLCGTSLCVATGKDFPDALAGGVFAGIQSSPLFLIGDSLSEEQSTFLKERAASDIFVFGGSGVISDELVDSIAKASK